MLLPFLPLPSPLSSLLAPCSFTTAAEASSDDGRQPLFDLLSKAAARVAALPSKSRAVTPTLDASGSRTTLKTRTLTPDLSMTRSLTAAIIGALPLMAYLGRLQQQHQQHQQQQQGFLLPPRALPVPDHALLPSMDPRMVSSPARTDLNRLVMAVRAARNGLALPSSHGLLPLLPPSLPPLAPTPGFANLFSPMMQMGAPAFMPQGARNLMGFSSFNSNPFGNYEAMMDQ